MKTIGDVVKKMNEEGTDEGVIHLQKKYVRHGCISLKLKDLEEVSPDLDVEEYMFEQDEEDVSWAYDQFSQDPSEDEDEESIYPLEYDGVDV